MDWHARKVLVWRLSDRMHAGFCVEAIEEALARFGRPAMFDTDQGGQFTSCEFTGVLQKHDVRISMEGRGHRRANVFIERHWRSRQDEAVYLHEIADGLAARPILGEWLVFYHAARPQRLMAGHRQRRTEPA
jgi:putative transposase